MRLRAALAIAIALASASCSGTAGTTPAPVPSAPPPGAISHIIIIVQENRSFNDLFAGFPGADTALHGQCKAIPQAWCRTAHEVPLRAIPLAQGLPSESGKDICHSHGCFVTECDADASNVCRNDGFDDITFGESSFGAPAKLYPYAYVRRSDVEPYWNLAKQYTLADHMFFTETAASFIAHQMLLTGTVRLNDRSSLTDQPNVMPWGCDARPKEGVFVPVLFRNGHENMDSGPFPCFDYTSIADLLDAANVSWRYYVDTFVNGPYQDFSGFVWNGFDALRKVRYGPDWKTNISVPNTNVFSDVRAGTLPAVSWVIPTLADSDHPVSGCNGGPRWVTKVVNAIGTSPYWKSTAIVLLWDDWGGWYDPVPPPQVNYTSLGFRVPMIVISPYSRPHYVSQSQYDFGSLLKFVEQTFDLGSLGTTDRTARSMEDVFDFTQTPNVFHAAPLPRKSGCADAMTRSRPDTGE
jgi:phospholipase C